MDIRKIKKLIELLEESSLTEIEIHEGESSVRLSRSQGMITTLAPGQMSSTSTVAGELPKPVVVEEPSGEKVVSPMVGTYYAAPSPESPDFVKIGSSVAVGDTLCVIEAMKIFNQIESTVAGTVTAMVKQNGDPVEYGETLFIIE
jgi:acetyl-CoA carboxylase biotin carboxyl carrier protein